MVAEVGSLAARRGSVARYYVNDQAQPNGDHEVHTSTCAHLPSPSHRVDLGEFASCWNAVSAARRHYTQSNGCVHCAAPCHTS